MRETDLYAPVKAYLEGQGYVVRAEVEDCDVVARRGDEPLVVVELKRTLNLELILQAIDRQKVTDDVYVAVPDDRRVKSKPLLRRSYREVLRLVRLLGLGLIVVEFRARSTKVDVVVDPAPYEPRKSPRKKRRLLREFEALSGDHNVGGSRGARVTAYRQDALACAAHLRAQGAGRPAAIRDATGVVRAGRIVYDNHYGWFERLGHGEYGLSDKGVAALQEYGSVLESMGDAAVAADPT
ncbi:MAG: DUF2161 family putative PD-(D/E)XK-type phosphodiesterase [Planctomycetota bacterium]